MWLVQVRQIDLVCIYTWIHLSFLGRPPCKNSFDSYMSIGHNPKKNLLSYTCHSACWKDATFIYMSFSMLKGRHFHIHVIRHVQRMSFSYTCHSTCSKDITFIYMSFNTTKGCYLKKYSLLQNRACYTCLCHQHVTLRNFSQNGPYYFNSLINKGNW